MTITIRPPVTLAEYRAIEWLEAEIWGYEVGVVPVHLLLTIAKEGGIVLLVFDEAENPIGFACAFVGLTKDRRVKLASHQAGVLSAYRNRGVGYQLKLAQREAALAQNFDLITWTFDPLQGRNARLNLRKLGAVCNTYISNLYGDMPDKLNQGLPSDRFRVDWWITTEHVSQRISGRFVEPELSPSVCPVLNPATILANGLLAPADTFNLTGNDCCLVEIPTDISRLKQDAPDLALKWRRQTREIFETAFDNGYTAVDLIRREGRNYYLLRKDWQPG